MIDFNAHSGVSRVLADWRKVSFGPMVDARLFEAALNILETTMAVPGDARDGGVASVAVAIPGSVPLFPGLTDPWQQIRHWDLKDWIAFLGLIVAIVGILVVVGQPRPQAVIAPEDVERIMRIIQQENGRTTSTVTPTTSNAPSMPRSTRPLDGGKDPTPAVRPSPTSGSW